MKRTALSMLLCLCIVLSVLTSAAAAQSRPTRSVSGEWEYQRVNSTTVEITKYTGRTPDLIVPDKIDGYSVESIGAAAFRNCEFLTVVSLPDSLEIIYEDAFSYCFNLKRLSIGAGVKWIGRNAFALCAFVSLTIPDSVEQIDAQAFRDCSYLTDVTFGSGVERIGAGAFAGCYNLNQVRFLGEAPIMGENVFYTADVTPPFSLVPIPGLTVYYTNGLLGWTTPLWKGYCAEPWHEHSYVPVVTKSTCTERGYTTYTCACGESYVDDDTDKLGHDMVTDAAVAPTCLDAGLTEGSHCSRCDYKIVQTEVTALGHDMVTDAAVAPTCLEAGLTEGSHCSRCDYKVTQTEVTALGHDMVTDAAVAPTCLDAGLTEGSHCSRCDYKVAQTEVTALGHDLVTDAAVAPTCFEAGLTEGSHCRRCDYKVAQTEVTALGHDLATDAAVAPTCTESGLTEGSHCSRCDYIIAQEKKDALGHDWDGGKVTTEPTETETGVKTYICSRCKATKTEDLAPLGALPFTDVPKENCFYDIIYFAWHDKLFAGTSATVFSPDGSMTRAMLVTVLWRMDGMPASGNGGAFSDVADGRYYTAAVAWAAENGIVNGIGNKQFDPDGNITREQIAVILFRYAAYKNCDTTGAVDLSKFSDSDKISPWAKQALAWANAEELINGMQSGEQKLLDPQGNATRAQAAAILMRYVQNITG